MIGKTREDREKLIGYATLLANGSEYNAVLKLEQILKNARRKFDKDGESEAFFASMVYLCYTSSHMLGGGEALKNEFRGFVKMNFIIDNANKGCRINNPQLEGLSLEELQYVLGYARKLAFYKRKAGGMSGRKPDSADRRQEKRVSRSGPSEAPEDMPEWKRKLREMKVF